MTELSERTEYAFAVGRIRALERDLLDRATLVRLLEEPLPGVCRILEEHGYPSATDTCGGMPEDRDATFYSPQFAKLKDQSLKSVFEEIASLSKHPEITSLLPLHYDALNLAWLLKAKAANTDPIRLFECGTIEIENLQRLIDDEGIDLPTPLREAYRAAIGLVDDVQNVRRIACIVIAVYWRHFLRVARASGLPFLRRIAARRIDSANLQTLVRLKREGSEQLTRLNEELLPAPPEAGELGAPNWEPVGFEPLPRSFFHRAWTEPLESLPAFLTGSAYQKAASEATAVSGFDDEAFERELDNLLGSTIRDARCATFGVEPLVAYGFAREIEASNLKILLGGRAVGLSPERIMEELRLGYV